MRKYWHIFTLKFNNTIIHPQFIMFSFYSECLKNIIVKSKNKRLIDIGSGNMPYRKILEPKVKEYIAVDHPQIYKEYIPARSPEILADVSKKLPIISNSFDVAIFLEVLEYIEDPLFTLKEINRILKPNSTIFITTPFLYPMLSMSQDRNRFTKTQLYSLLKQAGFKNIKIKENGNFLTVWMLFLLLFLLKRTLDILKSTKNIGSIIILLILGLLIPPLTLITNVIYLATRKYKSRYPNYFPIDYLVIATK